MAFHKSSLLVSKFGLAEEATEAIYFIFIVLILFSHAAIIRFSINNLSYI